jgi:hypothetical protein
MADETYTLIQKTTVTSAGASSISFTNIPQNFTDLVVMCSLRNATASTAQSGWVKFNGSSTGYAHKYLGGDGASASSAGDAAATRIYIGQVDGATATANTFANVSIYIPNYTSANYKSVSIDGVQETNATTAYATLSAGLWSNTDAITSISLETTAGNYVQYSSASLYGVAKFGVNPVAGPKASGGDIITNDGTYWIHQFLNSGTFTPSQTLSTEYLIVAGGGGGGFDAGGGGGAGGYRNFTSQSLTAATSYTATIGAGGAGSVITTSKGTNGTNSSFSTNTSSGGGGGGSSSAIVGAGASGGSGGGGRANGYAGGSGDSGGYTPDEGYAGGTSGNPAAGAGGGGSSAVGQNSTTTGTGGNGGAATSSSITGSSVNYAGGGGGAVNAATGGGAGAGTSGAGAGGTTVRGAGSAATVNLGGGGGGGGDGLAGGAGGSGIVIIRYAM